MANSHLDMNGHPLEEGDWVDIYCDEKHPDQRIMSTIIGSLADDGKCLIYFSPLAIDLNIPASLMRYIPKEEQFRRKLAKKW